MPALRLKNDQRRTEMIGALFTPEEMERIERVARSRGIHKGVLCRIAVLQEVSLEEVAMS